MVRVTPIRLASGTKVLWFDPCDIDIKAEDHVIVKTERGTEYGCATADTMEVSDELVQGLKSPLKPVLRVATEEDEERAADLAQQGEEALSVFKEFAADANDQMRPVKVDFLFDGDKAVFYFEAEERVDFRDLVRRLASYFRVRVDMRQIGVRDGARMIGGLGHCGQELCCKRLGGEFSPVSIRMAKEQNLSLNPQKISGCCGRLMCCLRYEFEAYKEVNSRAPKHGAKIELPDGTTARVSEINVPLERVTLQLEDGKSIKVPLDEMEVVGEGKRPNHISQEVLDKYTQADTLQMFGTSSFEVTTFTGNDKVADNEHRRRGRPSGADEADSSHRKRRRRRGGSGGSSSSEGKSSQNKQQRSKGSSSQESKQGEGSSSRRRRRGGSGSKSNKQAQRPRANDQRNRDEGTNRPGRRSSGVRNADQASKPQQQKRTQQQNQGEVAHRKPRRRRRRSSGEGTGNEQQQ